MSSSPKCSTLYQVVNTWIKCRVAISLWISPSFWTHGDLVCLWEVVPGCYCHVWCLVTQIADCANWVLGERSGKEGLWDLWHLRRSALRRTSTPEACGPLLAARSLWHASIHSGGSTFLLHFCLALYLLLFFPCTPTFTRLWALWEWGPCPFGSHYIPSS